MHRLLLVSTLVATAACASAPPPPPLTPQVQPGPAAGATPRRVLVLQASCGSIEFRCPREYIATVDQIVRSSLEFSGYALVSAEQLRNQTRSRHETHEASTTTTESSTTTTVVRPLDFDDRVTTEGATTTTTESSTIVLDGPGFDDLSVTERQEVLAKAGADAVVSIRMIVGALQAGWTPNQNVEVMVKLGVEQGDAMVWASRCMASSNDFSTVTGALENAARCAVYGGTGR